MMRRTTILLAAIALVLSAVMTGPHPAGASPARDIDPSLLALPASALPPGAVIDHSGVSDNADADGTTTPPDGFKSQLHILHQNFYEVLGRITGYRMDFHYTVQGAPVGTEYLASIFPSADKAKAAMNDAIGPNSLIQLIGQPLAQQCNVGDECRGYFGPNPGTTNDAVAAIFTQGPILVETASQTPAASFTQLEQPMETTLYALLAAADQQAKIAISGGPAPTSQPATKPTATNTPVPPTATPTPKPAKHHHKKKCKKGYKLVHGKCKKKKKKH